MFFGVGGEHEGKSGPHRKKSGSKLPHSTWSSIQGQLYQWINERQGKLWASGMWVTPLFNKHLGSGTPMPQPNCLKKFPEGWNWGTVYVWLDSFSLQRSRLLDQK